MIEPIRWLFGSPNHRQCKRAARSLLMFVGALIGVLAGSVTHTDLVALRAMERWGYGFSIVTLLAATFVNVAVLSFFLAVGGYGGYLIGEVLDEQAPGSRQLANYYLNRIACLALCMAGIAWAAYTAYQGGLPATVCALAAVLFLVACVRVITPLRELLGAKLGSF